MWYLLTVVLGVIGTLALLRGVERLAFGAGPAASSGVQLLIGVVALFLAWKALGKARGRK